MIRKSLILVAIALAVAPAALSGSLQHRPSLRVTSFAPLRVTGAHFVARERVRLRLSSQGTWQRTVRTNGLGAFTVTFVGVTVDRCNGFVLLARGASGDSATVKGIPFECPPP